MVILNAGEVNAGDFDPIAEAIAIGRRHDVWVHVDGAFGLFARLSPRTEHLARGVEGADSVTVDGHKWLNVPYDAGYAFVRDHELMLKAFRYTADYLPSPDEPAPDPGRPRPGELAAGARLRGLGDAREPTGATASAAWWSTTSTSRSIWQRLSTPRRTSSAWRKFS